LIPNVQQYRRLRELLPIDPLWDCYFLPEAEREVVGSKTSGIANKDEGPRHTIGASKAVEVDITTAATDAAKQWEGWGTALKPAHEPIVLARKPLIGTVAANVLTHGTGALNIDGARVGTESRPVMVRTATLVAASSMSGTSTGATGSGEVTTLGRWPANVIFDTEAGALLDEQSGVSSSAKAAIHQPRQDTDNAVYGHGLGTISPTNTHNDSGGASRFFTAIDWEPEVDVPFRYVPKPSKRERNAGLELCRCDKLSVTNKTEEQTWDSEDQQAAHPVDTDRSHQRDTGVSTTQHSDDSAWSTFSYGSSTTGQSPTDTKSTTSTTTNLTTESATLRSSTPQITSGSTQDARSATVNGGNLANSAENLNQSTKTIGTSARKVGRNTDDADPATSDRSSRISVAGRCDRCNKINTAHPTQKPLALMRWLVRLVTPPGGTVLEPFAGSGTTLMACVLEGFHGIGIEMTDEYLPIIEGRVRWAQHQPQRLNL
jgi:hypothetical protein